MAVGYEEIDNLMQEQNTLLDKQKAESDKMIETGLQKTQNEVNRQKEEYEREATKQGKALYTDYRKQANPYGATAEQLASQGLNKSGYAETTQTRLYNEYQRNVTSLMTETTRLKAEADFQMNQAFLDADIQKAQNALSIYQQQAELAITNYNLRYQKYRDDVADAQWEKSYQLQKQQAQQSQANWEREYQLSLEKARRSS